MYWIRHLAPSPNPPFYFSFQSVDQYPIIDFLYSNDLWGPIND